MREQPTSITKIIATSHVTAGLWLAGWLFTLGFVHLGGWKALWALVTWPYFLGATVRAS